VSAKTNKNTTTIYRCVSIFAIKPRRLGFVVLLKIIFFKTNFKIEVEEEMMFNDNNYDQDDYSRIARKMQQNDLDSNKNISRFVNQHQTDIKSLLS